MAWDDLRASYDTVAATYAAQFDDELVHKLRDRALLDTFAAVVTDPVVDLGCGPGQIGRRVQAQGRRVIGIDLSEEMARLAGTRLAPAVADLRSLPLRSAGVGGVVAFYSLIHVRRDELVPTLREVHRVLRPGGRALIAMHEGHGELEVDEFLGEPVPFVATLVGLAELTDACSNAGFEVVLAEQRPPYATEHPTNRIYVEAVRPAREVDPRR